jgi:hypothetical protein
MLEADEVTTLDTKHGWIKLIKSQQGLVKVSRKNKPRKNKLAGFFGACSACHIMLDMLKNKLACQLVSLSQLVLKLRIAEKIACSSLFQLVTLFKCTFHSFKV